MYADQFLIKLQSVIAGFHVQSIRQQGEKSSKPLKLSQ